MISNLWDFFLVAIRTGKMREGILVVKKSRSVPFSVFPLKPKSESGKGVFLLEFSFLIALHVAKTHYGV